MTQIETAITIPENVKISKEDTTITAEGPNATLQKSFAHSRITITQKDNLIEIKTDSTQKKDKATLGTWTAHLKNMLKGAEKDFEYHLKILYTHFPMTLKQEGDNIIITNFMGEKGTRKAHIKEGVKVNIQKEDMTLTGPSKENVGQSAANLEQACKHKKKDIRIYQDGIYITKKTKYLAYINMSNAALNIVLNFILISRYGIWGAAFATLVCFTYKVLITYYISNKLYKISFEAGRLLKLAFVAVTLYFACHYISLGIVYTSMLLKFGVACLFPILLFLLKFYTAEEKAILKGLLKEPRFVLSEIWGR